MALANHAAHLIVPEQLLGNARPLRRGAHQRCHTRPRHPLLRPLGHSVRLAEPAAVNALHVLVGKEERLLSGVQLKVLAVHLVIAHHNEHSLLLEQIIWIVDSKCI